MTEKALSHANCLTELTDDEFSKLVALNLFNPETGQLRISEKFITNFTKLTPEQEARLIDYDLLNRDGSRQTIKKSFTVVDGTQVLMMLQLSSADFQKLVDKNLFNIKVNGSPLKTNDIILLENIEPEVINKIINDIMPLNSKITVKEALVLSKLSKTDLAKIQKFNLFEEKVASRYFSSDIDGDTVLMLSAFRKAKNGDTYLVNLKPAEVIKIAQQPEEVIPNLLKLLKNKNVKKFAFDDLVKMS